MKKAAIIVAFRDFRDEEYFIPKQVLRSFGIEVVTVSSQKGKAIGSYGGVVNIEKTLDEIKVSGFDAVLFAGGSGAANYINNAKCHKIANEAAEKGKILGAICMAPAILARAGVLKNKKATCWQSALDKSVVKILKDEGAHYMREPVVIDGRIITASGWKAARKFGEAIARYLTNS